MVSDFPASSSNTITSVDDELQGGTPEVSTTDARIVRDREKIISNGSPPFYGLTEYYYSGGSHEGEKYHENRIDYVGRHSHRWSCKDTIRNPNFDPKKFKFPADNGGPLVSYKVEWIKDNVMNFHIANPWYIVRSGTAYNAGKSYTHNGIEVLSSLVPPSVDLSVTDMGPLLWNRMRPAKPTVSLGVALGEARELPRLLQARLAGIKSISDLYLAAQFGWRPLLSDIVDMLNFVERASNQIDFILNNIGKPLHRSYSIPQVTTEDVLYSSSGTTECWSTPAWGYTYFGGSPDYGLYSNTLKLSLQTRVWGSGMFVFYFNNGRIPERPEIMGKLLGLALTPSLAWELIPWSWLIDWYSNFGEILSNLSAEVADNQVSIYAYAMKETWREYTWTSTDGYIATSVSKRYASKVRERINPFGLSSYSSSLNDYQKGILAALAISRY